MTGVGNGLRPGGGQGVARSEPGRILLGTATADVATISRMVDRLRIAIDERAKELLTDEDKQAFYVENWPLDFEWYCTYATELKQLTKEFQRNNGVITSVRDNAALRGLCVIGWRPALTPDLQGWVNYLIALNGGLAEVIANLNSRAEFSEEGRQAHTMIVAPSDWGKSELMKALAFHYAEQPRGEAVVVLDPGGDMVKQMARWPELVRSERALLIRPGLQDGMTVCFNPLDGTALKTEEDRREVAVFWASQLGALTKETSVIQERMLRNCMLVLLAYPGGANLQDLVLLLEAKSSGNKSIPRQKELLAFAREYPHHHRVGQYFRHDFPHSNCDYTKQTLLDRLDWLLLLPHVEAMVCGEPRFSLENAIEDRKFILVDLSAFTGGSAAVGRLFVAMLGALGRRRHQLPAEKRIPTHVFIDEVSTMVSEELLLNLKELRKFGIYQTLAQQVDGDKFSPSYRRILSENTGCKMVATRGAEAADILRVGTKLPLLTEHNFWVRWARSGNDLGCITVRSDLAGWKNKVPDNEWEKYSAAMVQKYYSKAELMAPVIQREVDPSLPRDPGPQKPHGPSTFRPAPEAGKDHGDDRIPPPNGSRHPRSSRGRPRPENGGGNARA